MQTTTDSETGQRGQRTLHSAHSHPVQHELPTRTRDLSRAQFRTKRPRRRARDYDTCRFPVRSVRQTVLPFNTDGRTLRTKYPHCTNGNKITTAAIRSFDYAFICRIPSRELLEGFFFKKRHAEMIGATFYIYISSPRIEYDWKSETRFRADRDRVFERVSISNGDFFLKKLLVRTTAPNHSPDSKCTRCNAISCPSFRVFSFVSRSLSKSWRDDVKTQMRLTYCQKVDAVRSNFCIGIVYWNLRTFNGLSSTARCIAKSSL